MRATFPCIELPWQGSSRFWLRVVSQRLTKYSKAGLMESLPSPQNSKYSLSTLLTNKTLSLPLLSSSSSDFLSLCYIQTGSECFRVPVLSAWMQTTSCWSLLQFHGLQSRAKARRFVHTPSLYLDSITTHQSMCDFLLIWSGYCTVWFIFNWGFQQFCLGFRFRDSCMYLLG